jgi:hypothetical protein
MLPIPENGLGPRCLPGPDDTPSTPHGCQPWEGRNSGHYDPKYKNGHVPGPCVPCPETPGSDCSRCDNGGANAKSPAFPSPYNGIAGAPKEGVLDVIKIPHDLPPGEYVLGWCVLVCPAVPLKDVDCDCVHLTAFRVGDATGVTIARRPHRVSTQS